MLRRIALALATAVAVASLSAVASAESVIKRPGDHPDYLFEAEPHGLVGFWGPFAKGSVGAGFRGTLNLLDNGFISSINDSVGLTFGADFFFGGSQLYVPVAMQWNFWLTKKWSIFGEPGIAFTPGRKKGSVVDPLIMGGGRFHFSDSVALTLRAGYPAASVGISFFL